MDDDLLDLHLLPINQSQYINPRSQPIHLGHGLVGGHGLLPESHTNEDYNRHKGFVEGLFTVHLLIVFYFFILKELNGKQLVNGDYMLENAAIFVIIQPEGRN